MQFDLFSQSNAHTQTPATATPLTDIAAMQHLLQRWVERRWLRALDVQLPQTLHQLAAESNPLLWLLTALLCHQYGRGHSCILLQDLIDDADALLSLPPQNQFMQRFSDKPSTVLSKLTLCDVKQALSHSNWVCEAEQVDKQAAPLVLCDNRLYLHRLYQAERLVQQQIYQRVHAVLPLKGAVDAQLSTLFPSLNNGQPDWQKLACIMALQRRFAIITGGPGTGKTTTVVKLLALLQQRAANTLQIKLAAPTGKAAVRLTESISGAMSKLPQAMQHAIPTEVTTLHRLLGAVPNRRSFRHHADNPLQLDVLVVDEASMVDLEMMAALLSALPAQAQLVLLGDKDQLSSVEAGSVLGDLCRGAEAGGYHADTLALISPYSSVPLTAWQGEGTALNQATVMLRHSHRFSSASGIGMLAAAVNRGDKDAFSLCDQFADIDAVQAENLSAIKAQVLAGFSHYLSEVNSPMANADNWARQVLASYSRYQLLCALRNGEWGVEGINQQVTDWLTAVGNIQGKSQWYSGRPVMMQRNNYALGLMNGDIGIALVQPDSGQLRVAFQLADGSIKWVLPSRLTEVETAFCMTVHKSQGSEFSHCCLILPPQQSPILTRELLYTAITRAKQRFSLLCASRALLPLCISRAVKRCSGL